MTRLQLVVVSVLGSVVLGVPAHGALLCQKKSGAVFVRDACKKKETTLDATGLGLKGDKGDPGDPAQSGSRAYALVSRSVAFKNGIVKQFTAVMRPRTGVYCLTVDPAAGIDTTTIVPQITVDWEDSLGNNLMANFDSSDNDCSAGQFEINTFIFPTGGNAALSDGVDFFVTIP